ncbi:P-loop containing nucleoside triphosphate hydrolase protein, partial [Dimargaris cristalligena]
GPSCSGKTTLARQIQALVPHCVVAHQDDFFRPESKIPIDPVTGLANWDCNEAIDWPRLTAALLHFRQFGRLPEYRLTELPSSTEPHLCLSASAREQLSPLVQTLSHSTQAILLVDGFLLFHQPTTAQLFDARILISASYETIKERRLNRPNYQTLEGWWVDPPNYFDLIVWPHYLAHLPASEAHAGLVIKSDHQSVNEMVTQVVSYMAQCRA